VIICVYLWPDFPDHYDKLKLIGFQNGVRIRALNFLSPTGLSNDSGDGTPGNKITY